MIKILNYIIKLLINFKNKIESSSLKDKLTLIRISRNTLGRNITFVLNNNKMLENKALFNAIYLYLMTNKDFLKFGEHKVIIVNGKIKNETFNLHHNILIKNNTTFEEYWDKIKDIIMDRYEEGYAIEGIPMVEINVWNMDHLANKKIKITRNALTGRDIFTITDKDVMNSLRRIYKKSSLENKKFYSTKVKDLKNDNCLNYITPIKPKKEDINKSPLSFSAMDIETLEINNKEIPISISIKTKLTSKIFIIDQNKLTFSKANEDNLNLQINELWDKFFDFILKFCDKDIIFVHNLGGFDGFSYIKL
jgi:hypothetical protein